VSNLGEEEGMKLAATVDRTSVGTVLSKLAQEEGDKPSHLDDWLSEVPHHMDDVELHHDEVAAHSEVFADLQHL
jgi:hypothetical protein